MRRSKRKPDAEEVDLAGVRRVSLDLLARREYSQVELRRKLAERDLPEGLVDEVLEALAAEGLQSDARYVEAFVHSRIERGQGPVRIRQELRARGAPDDLAVAALADEDRAAWRARAERVRRQKFGDALPSDWAGKVKQAKFLQQRGFAMEHIQLDVDADG